MSIFFYIAIIIFVSLAIKRLLSRKPRDTELVKLLCPKCDNVIAEVGLPSGTVSLLRAVGDQWMSRVYTRIKLVDVHLFVCPECSSVTRITRKEIFGEK